MNYSEAFKKLDKIGQTHLLKWYDTLNDEEKKILLDRISMIDEKVLSSNGSNTFFNSPTVIAFSVIVITYLIFLSVQNLHNLHNLSDVLCCILGQTMGTNTNKDIHQHNGNHNTSFSFFLLNRTVKIPS